MFLSCRMIVVLTMMLISTMTLQSQNMFRMSNLLGDQSFRSGLVIGIADMNGDFVDDIVRLNKGKNLTIDYGNGIDTIFLRVTPGVSSKYSPWSMTIGDINNDGNNDIIIGGNRTGIFLWKFGDNGAFMEEVGLENGNIYVQATNLVDINNDGWLDLFVCNDEGTSQIYINDGAGNLNYTEELIDLATATPSDNSGNYGSIWTDFDQDGDLDLYISKCKAGVDDPTDPRRINQLYLNDGNNQFSEGGMKWGLGIGDQSWIADFGDVDNDGDMDCLILNHDVPSKLMINQGDTFYNYTDSMGVKIQGPLLQGFFEDVNNDGLLDILVAGAGAYVYLNQGNYQFKPSFELNAPEVMTSMSVGDFNRDGFIDIYGIYSHDFVEPGTQNDLLWLNNGNANNYVDVQVVGTESNYNGVGATVRCFGPWGMQIREFRAGESYGVTASSLAHFGLGEFTQMDSLNIRWPSGLQETFTGLGINQKHLIIENTCVSQPEFSEYIGNLSFCSGDSVQFVINSSNPAVWNTGDTSSEFTIKESGIYFAKIIKSYGCFDITASINVIVDPDEMPKVNLSNDSVLCAGNEVTLSLPVANGYSWNTGSSERFIQVDQNGKYYASIEGLCADFNSDTVSVRFLEPTDPLVQDITMNEPGPVSLSAIGDSLHWYQDIDSFMPVFIGAVYEIDSVGKTNTWYVSNINIFAGNSAVIGESQPKAIDPYNNNNFNGRLFFNVYQSLFLESVTVYTDSPATRIIEIVKDGERIFSKEFHIDTGKTILDLDFFLEPGEDYYLSTNSALNMQNFGSLSPRLWRTMQPTLNYPYGNPSTLQITRTNFTEQEYYYFYDWKIKVQDKYCESEKFPLTVHVTSTSLDPILISNLKVYPNPTTQMFTIQPERGEVLEEIRIYTIAGKKVLAKSLKDEHKIDLGDLPSGIYLYRILTKQSYGIGKIIKE